MNDLATSAYSAPLGSATLTMTGVGTAVLLGVGVLQIVLGLNRVGGQRKALLVGGCVVISLIFASLLMRIHRYELTGDRLRISYGVGQHEVLYSDVTEVSRDRHALSGSTRTAANGGLWSFLGQYSNPQLGDMDVYVSDPERIVLLKLKKGVVVISPEDPDKFVADIRARKGGDK